MSYLDPTHLIWPWQVWRYYRVALRDLAVKHARERAELDLWEIECRHALREAGYDY